MDLNNTGWYPTQMDEHFVWLVDTYACSYRKVFVRTDFTFKHCFKPDM